MTHVFKKQITLYWVLWLIFLKVKMKLFYGCGLKNHSPMNFMILCFLVFSSSPPSGEEEQRQVNNKPRQGQIGNYRGGCFLSLQTSLAPRWTLRSFSCDIFVGSRWAAFCCPASTHFFEPSGRALDRVSAAAALGLDWLGLNPPR